MMILRGSILLAALLSSTFAQNRMYWMGTGTETGECVYGDVKINLYSTFFKQRQEYMIEMFTKVLENRKEEIDDLVNVLNMCSLKDFARHFRTQESTLASLVKYSNLALRETVREFQDNGYEQFLIHLDGSRFKIDPSDRVVDVPDISWWDAEWAGAKDIWWRARSSDLMYIKGVEDLQLLLRVNEMMPLYFKNKIALCRMGITPGIIQRISEFPYIKGYYHERERLFCNLEEVDDTFFINTLTFSVRVATYVRTALDHFNYDFSDSTGALFEAQHDDMARKRWVVFANGDVQRFDVNKGNLVQDLDWFDSWFYDWVQLAHLMNPLFQKHKAGDSHDYIAKIKEDFAYAQHSIDNMLKCLQMERMRCVDWKSGEILSSKQIRKRSAR
eukprot:Lankesteria_metandrocarpae@DN605_c0_g1_i1.p1